MKMEVFKKESKTFTISFIEKVLGSVPPDEDTFKKFILNKGGKEEEISTLPDEEEIDQQEINITVFHRLNGRPFLYDYVIKGFFKSAIAFLMENKAIKKIPAYKTRIDKFVFIHPRMIFFKDKHDIDGKLTRGLRAMTAQGPRITLVTSEYIDAGSQMEFRVDVYKNQYIDMDIIEKALGYGLLMGLGRWHSGGWGRFVVLKTRKC